MTKIKLYVEGIADEIKGAKEYAEKYLWYKAKGNTTRSSRYKEMATQELEHASNLHEFATEDIESLERVYPEIPNDMMEAWDKSHKEYVEKVAWVKQMLSM